MASNSTDPHNQQISIANNGDGEFDMSDVFSTRNPKDVGAGLSSGLKSFSKGLAGGLVSLVALPVAKAREEGAVGFAKGLGLGVLSAVTLTLAGAGTGVVQIGRGIANTPGAIKARMDDKVWDEENRVWILYNLKEEAVLILKEDLDAQIVSNQVKEREFYDLLGIQPTATTSEIKKAYRQRAIVLHPDKNPNDPNASENFQQLGNAYQVLSNPELRKNYDKFGKSGLDEKSLMDSSQLFEVIFGSQRFDAYVGELQLLSMKDSVQAMDEKNTEQSLKMMREGEILRAKKQKKREVQAAVNLSKLIEPYLTDESEEHLNFRLKIIGEAKELAGTPFGGTLIGVLVELSNQGYVYKEQAIDYLGFDHNIASGLGLNGFAKSAHVLASKYRVLSSAVKILSQAQKAQERMESAKAAKAAGAGNIPDIEMDPNTMESMMETLWNITVIDVESTLRQVCFKLLNDTSVPKGDRIKRAHALLMVGEIFESFGNSQENGLKELSKQFGHSPSTSPTPASE